MIRCSVRLHATGGRHSPSVNTGLVQPLQKQPNGALDLLNCSLVEAFAGGKGCFNVI